VRAGTDVTGFGLIGHLGNLTRASGLAAEIAVSNLPLMAGVRELAAAGLVPGGTTRNLDAATQVEWAAGVSEIDRVLVADAQTSGGLLLAVAPERLDTLLASLASEQTLASAVIGRLVAGSAGTIRVEA
jgi:selenide,water dikinase